MASSGDGPPGSWHPPDPNNAQYQKVRLSPDEFRALRECNRESFYYRCLPLGIATMTATHWAVKTGYLKPNVKWGSAFKVLGAGLFSYVLGKYSYQRECAEKLMQLPSSQIGEALRQKYGRTLPERFLHEIDQNSSSLRGGAETSAGDYSTSVNADADRNIQHQGLDDTFRPTVDSPTVPLEEQPLPPGSQSTTTYDELRQKNREEYQGKRHETYSRRQEPYPPPVQPAPRTRAPDEPPSGRKVKNKYGDVWED